MARYGATAHSLTDETFLLFGGTNTEHSFGEYFIFNTGKKPNELLPLPKKI
jgi:hypothetical protein